MDGCVCTAVICSFSFLYIYCVAVCMYNVQHVNVRHTLQNLPVSSKEIMFPSMSVSTLYCTINETWFDDVIYCFYQLFTIENN